MGGGRVARHRIRRRRGGFVGYRSGSGDDSQGTPGNCPRGGAERTASDALEADGLASSRINPALPRDRFGGRDLALRVAFRSLSVSSICSMTDSTRAHRGVASLSGSKRFVHRRGRRARASRRRLALSTSGGAAGFTVRGVRWIAVPPHLIRHASVAGSAISHRGPGMRCGPPVVHSPDGFHPRQRVVEDRSCPVPQA